MVLAALQSSHSHRQGEPSSRVLSLLSAGCRDAATQTDEEQQEGGGGGQREAAVSVPSPRSWGEEDEEEDGMLTVLELDSDAGAEEGGQHDEDDGAFTLDDDDDDDERATWHDGSGPSASSVRDLCLRLEAEAASLRALLATTTTSHQLLPPPQTPDRGVAPSSSSFALACSSSLQHPAVPPPQQPYAPPPMAYVRYHHRGDRHHHHLLEIMSDDGRGGMPQHHAGLSPASPDFHPSSSSRFRPALSSSSLHVSPVHHRALAPPPHHLHHHGQQPPPLARCAEDGELPHQPDHDNSRAGRLRPRPSTAGEGLDPLASRSEPDAALLEHHQHPVPARLPPPYYPPVDEDEDNEETAASLCPGFGLLPAGGGGGMLGLRSRLCDDMVVFVSSVLAVNRQRRWQRSAAISRCRQVVQSLWPRAQVREEPHYLPSPDRQAS